MIKYNNTLSAIILATLLTGCTMATTMQPMVEYSDTSITMRGAKPVYPYKAFKEGIEGYVVIEIEYDKFGNIVNTHIIESSPAGYFEESDRKHVESLYIKRYYGIPIGGEKIRRTIVYKLDNK